MDFDTTTNGGELFEDLITAEERYVQYIPCLLPPLRYMAPISAQ